MQDNKVAEIDENKFDDKHKVLQRAILLLLLYRIYYQKLHAYCASYAAL